MYRIFPISHNYYLSQLIFSPDASKPSRILIGKEVHTAEEYSARIAPLRRHWPNPLLRFSIYDETPHKVPSSTVDDSRKIPSPLSFMAVPPPPVILSPPAPSSDTRGQDFLYRYRPLPTPSFATPPTPFIPPPPPPIIFSPGQLSPIPPFRSPQGTATQSCCSVAKGKSEMESLLSSFKKDFDHIMRNTFGPQYDSDVEFDTSNRQTTVSSAEAPTAAPPTSSEASYGPVHISPDPQSPHWCFVCRNEFSGSWYGCIKCPWHFVVSVLCFGPHVLCLPICQCQSCFSKSGATHTFSFGPTHVVRQHGLNAVPPSIAVTPPVAEVSADSQSRRTSPAVDAEPNQCQPVVHRNVACDNCKKTVVGVRHKCLDCPGKVMIMHHNTVSSYISQPRL